MADITMCNGDKCPLKFKCYRFTAPKSNRQSFFVEVPFKNGLCDHYWDNSNR